MKRLPTLHRLLILLVSICLTTAAVSQPTTNRGRVVINEYMPWPSNGCGATSEFIELLNFGPGPVDIGCYIITEGDFSITIPPNTILKPGEYYVIAGQNVIAFPCANIDSTITVDLNWNTCGCTSAPIPTTGDGLFTDGGAASEQLVLLDPFLNVVDAVVRDLPAETSSVITTAAMNGCIPHTFDLDLMTVNYEVLGMSAGRGNFCPKSVPIFDGESRMDLKLSAKGTKPFKTDGFEGEVIVCGIKFIPKSGYRKGRDDVDYLRKLETMEIWFAKADAVNVYAPVYVRIPTRLGPVTVWATRFGG